MIGLKKSSVVKPEGAMGFCRSGSWVFGCKTAMPSVRRGAIWLVLSTRRARRGRCGSHELDRRAIYGDAFLRKSEDGCVFELPWSLCESEAGTKVNAGDGDSRDMPWAQYQPTQNGSCGVSVSFEGGCDQEAESRLEYGYYLYSSCPRICVFGSNFRLVFTIRSFVEVVEYFGDFFLYGGIGRGIRESFSGYFQYGSGLSVYEPRFYGAVKKERDQNQHGWERKSVRQYICGATLEKCEIREHLSDGLSNDGRGKGGIKTLFSILQQRAFSSSAPISNTKTGLHGRHELERINKFEMIYKEEGKDKKQTS